MIRQENPSPVRGLGFDKSNRDLTTQRRAVHPVLVLSKDHRKREAAMVRYEATMRVIALDPGGTTGWATYTEYTDREPEWACAHIGPEEHHVDLYEFLEIQHCRNTTVVCESFEFRQNRQRDNINLMSREYIGIVKLFGKQRNVPVVFQTAGLAKGFVTDEKLKKMGLWAPGHKHAMDARRHLVYYMVNKLRRHDLVESWKDLV